MHNLKYSTHMYVGCARDEREAEPRQRRGGVETELKRSRAETEQRQRLG